MDRFDLYRRVHANLSNLDWKVLMFGSPKEDREPGSDFSEAHEKCLQQGLSRLRKTQVDRRLIIFDRSILGDDITAERLTAIVAECKNKCKATRALIVIDYLQLLPVPDDIANRGDLSADKFRVRMLQQVIEGSKTTKNPLGDAVLAISEARKPATAKDPWGQSLSELMGTARVGYAPTAVLLYRPMDFKEMQHYYDTPLTRESAEKYRQALAEIGIAPLMLILEKGRDGTIRGKWGVEFHFWKLQFRELEHGSGTNVHSLPPHIQDMNDKLTAELKANAATALPPPLPPMEFGHKKTAKKPGNTPPKAHGKMPPKVNKHTPPKVNGTSKTAPKSSKKK